MNDLEFFGIKLIDADDFFKLIIRLIIHFTIMALICLLYYQKNKNSNKNYVFALTLIGSVVFLLCFLLENVKIELGFAVGLFAIFGILRYRTLQIPIKEMTYMFVIIGVGVINALSNKKISYTELIFTNVFILFIIVLLEKRLFQNMISQSIEYEKIELIKPGRREELLKDLKERTGLNILKIEIGRINFLRDTVRIRIYYKL